MRIRETERVQLEENKRLFEDHRKMAEVLKTYVEDLKNPNNRLKIKGPKKIKTEDIPTKVPSRFTFQDFGIDQQSRNIIDSKKFNMAKEAKEIIDSFNDRQSEAPSETVGTEYVREQLEQKTTSKSFEIPRTPQITVTEVPRDSSPPPLKPINTLKVPESVEVSRTSSGAPSIFVKPDVEAVKFDEREKGSTRKEKRKTLLLAPP
jgi:hypothetical protein